MASYTLEQLAAHVGGRIIGDPKTEIRRAAGLEKAGAFDISFLANPKYVRKMKTTRAAAVVVREPSPSSASLLVADDPYYAFTQIIVRIHGHRRHPIEGVSRKAAVAPSAIIGDGARIHDNVTIEPGVRIGGNCVLYPGVYIGPETEIGDDCLFYPNAVVYDRCRIGSRVILQANAVVGQDGFGFSTHNGIHYKIPHVGGVVIEDDVELGAGCAIERGALEDTVIGKGSKIGDLVVIGHGARVGPHCLLVAQVGVAGSTVIGRHCVAGGQAGIAGHLAIGNQVMIGAQSGVGHDAGDGEKLLGSPAIDVSTAKRAYLMIRHLPEMARTLRDLRKRMDLLESRSK